MAHHSSSPFPESLVAQYKQYKLGATGEFPQGKLTEHDEGEIRLAVGQRDGKVVMNFGKPTSWIGFDAEQAEELAATLRQHAIECRLRRSSSEK